MTVLVGGSGSTGSSLLAVMLNRHGDVCCGPELNFFNKEQLFEDWGRAKRRLFDDRGIWPLTTRGWGPYAGSNLLAPEYGWTRSEVEALIGESESLDSFVARFFSRPLERKGARMWIEKTPSNAFSFNRFLKRFREGLVVHTTRDPRDAVASLVRRGFTPYFAAGVWVYNTAAALGARRSPGYHLVKYEHLVEDPAGVMRELCTFLGLPPTDDVLDASKSSGSSTTGKLASWSSATTDPVNKRSVGGFWRLEDSLQREVVSALSAFRISRRHVRERSLEHRSCQEICETLGYEFDARVHPDDRMKLAVDQARDFVARSARLYATGLTRYPGRLSWR